MAYSIREVAGSDAETAETIHRFNSLAPECFPALQPRHFNGYWWLVFPSDHVAPVAFAGLVPMVPFESYGYLKRAYVKPEHRGQGLQLRLLLAREARAAQLGWTHLVSEHSAENYHSARNFERAGYSICDPEQRWGQPDSIYWVKKL